MNDHTYEKGNKVNYRWPGGEPDTTTVGEVVQVGGDYLHKGSRVYVGIHARPRYWVYWRGIDRNKYPPTAYSAKDLAPGAPTLDDVELMDLPAAFVEAFIAEAEKFNGDDEPLPLGQSDSRTLVLTNDWPGFSAYLRIGKDGDKTVVFIIGLATEEQREFVDATAEVDLTDPAAAAKAAVEAWNTTL